MPELSEADIHAALSGDPEELGVYLSVIDRDVTIEGRRVSVHCHCLNVDANGKVKINRLTEFMRNVAADYAIPKSKLAEARERDFLYRSTSAVSELNQRARKVFTDLAKTGEGGEMLLFLLAERFLGLPLVLCKMDLKTDSRVHFHGADGVYSSITPEGLLKLYWGESKLYAEASTAIRECLRSLAPFLIEDDSAEASRERDLLLLSDRADLGDERVSTAFKRYFDKTLPLSNRVQYCGIALVGFNASFYPGEDASAAAEEILRSAKEGLGDWVRAVGLRLDEEKLNSFDVHFMCVPFPSVEHFREAFLNAMGGE
jgi:hypothetical protein